MSENYERKIVVVGKTGNGKSSLGNVLLRRCAFYEAHSFNAITKECEVDRDEGNLSVIDTPGLFDSDGDRSLAQQALEVQRAIKLCPNPHAFLIVLNGSTRLTQEELSTIDVLHVIFGEQCLKRAIIVLTHIGNNVEETQLKGMLTTSSAMSNLIRQCGNRFARIDNREPKPEHIERINRLVDQVSRAGRNSFKNGYLHLHKQVLQEALENHDSGPVHIQIKLWSEQITEAVEEEKKFNRKCWKAAGMGAVCVVAGITHLGGGSRTVATAATNLETAQVVIEKSVNVATGVISYIRSTH
ncbi:GTPase IMAP family member 9-like [Mercenaria mercenaria]|uniref:GTPase IMAP family member 9-like n=1 Tax=Mercenaria mercenaria TaxID=6596 RepID=UPI00234F7845|nr:GTPase IMAP family member 9-like [Mercenaria mercenaria]